MDFKTAPKTFLSSLKKLAKITGIVCSRCDSKEIRYTAEFRYKSTDCRHKYHCLNCNHEFNLATSNTEGSDDSGKHEDAIFELPIETWIQCWYLSGCTSSLTYIAAKLNLDLNTIEHMIRELQKIFKVDKPATGVHKYKEWRKQFGAMQKKLAAQIKIKHELYQGYSASKEHDTAEKRRVDQRRNQNIKN